MKIKTTVILLSIFLLFGSCAEEVPADGLVVVDATWVKRFYYQWMRPIDQVEVGIFENGSLDNRYYQPDNALMTDTFTDGKITFPDIPRGIYTIGGSTRKEVEVMGGETVLVELFERE